MYCCRALLLLLGIQKKQVSSCLQNPHSTRKAYRFGGSFKHLCSNAQLQNITQRKSIEGAFVGNLEGGGPVQLPRWMYSAVHWGSSFSQSFTCRNPVSGSLLSMETLPFSLRRALLSSVAPIGLCDWSVSLVTLPVRLWETGKAQVQLEVISSCWLPLHCRSSLYLSFSQCWDTSVDLRSRWVHTEACQTSQDLES